MSIDLSSMSIDSVHNNSQASFMSIDSTYSVPQGIPPLRDMALHVANIVEKEKGWFPSKSIDDKIMTLASWFHGNQNLDPDLYLSIYSSLYNNGPLSRTFDLMDIIWSTCPVHF